MRCWCGYLSGARCRWSACGPADVVMPLPSSIASYKSRLVFYLSGTGLPRLSWKRGHSSLWLQPVMLGFPGQAIFSSTCDDDDNISLLVKQQMTNANVKKAKSKKRKKHQKRNIHWCWQLQKMNRCQGIKVFTKTILTYGKDVTMSSRTQTTEILLRWKYVRQAVVRSLYTRALWTLECMPLHWWLYANCIVKNTCLTVMDRTGL